MNWSYILNAVLRFAEAGCANLATVVVGHGVVVRPREAITISCESCISMHAEAAAKADATESEIAGAQAAAVSLDAVAACTLRPARDGSRGKSALKAKHKAV